MDQKGNAKSPSQKRPTGDLDSFITNECNRLKTDTVAALKTYAEKVEWMRCYFTAKTDEFKKNMMICFLTYASQHGKFRGWIGMPFTIYTNMNPDIVCKLSDKELEGWADSYSELLNTGKDGGAEWRLPILNDGGAWAMSMYSWIKGEFRKHFQIDSDGTRVYWHAPIPMHTNKPLGTTPIAAAAGH